ncbi:MAG: DCC1-like thiol-disulfide oxidoreductase family protein [Planctomycetota bacterium]
MATPPPNPAIPPLAADAPLVIFDGDCGMCQRSVRLMLRLDKPGRLRFTPRDSTLALRITDAAFPDGRPESMILRDARGLHTNSTAVLRIAACLPAPWRWAAALLVIPRSLRDPLYRLIARNRHRLAGPPEDCPAPTPEQQARFIA